MVEVKNTGHARLVAHPEADARENDGYDESELSRRRWRRQWRCELTAKLRSGKSELPNDERSRLRAMLNHEGHETINSEVRSPPELCVYGGVDRGAISSERRKTTLRRALQGERGSARWLYGCAMQTRLWW